jgi:predicted ATPase
MIGACCPGRPVPRPVAELLDGDAQHPAEGADAAAATLRRFDAIVQYLTGASATTPLMIVLDHLHQADPTSLRLLAHLAESVPGSHLVMAVAYRSVEAPALAETSAALARAEMTRLELDGLSVEETRALAVAMLHREVSESTARELRSRTGGNPFYLRELIKLLAADERLDRPRSVPVPAPARDVVLGRLAQLPSTAAELLSVASIAGRHFAIDVVAEVASVEIDAALEAVDTIVAAGLIEEDQQRLGWYYFTHALTLEVLHQNMGRLRRSHLQGRIGRADARSWTWNIVKGGESDRHRL